MEQAREREARQNAMQRFYAQFGLNGKDINESAELMLMALAEVHDKVLTRTQLKGYATALTELSVPTMALGFAKAHLELRFFPSPSVLLELCGLRTHSLSEEDQATRELIYLFGRMREGCRTLRPTYMREEKADEPGVWVDSKTLYDPRISERQKIALMILGLGSYNAGVYLLQLHSAVSPGRRNEETFRVDRDIETRWLKAWRESANPIWDWKSASERE